MKKRGSILIITLLCVSSFMFMFSPITNESNTQTAENSERAEDDIEPKVSTDSYDPNEDFTTASYLSEGWYYSLQCDDDDYYEFYADKGQLITVSIFFTHADGNLDLRLFDSAYSERDGSYSWNDDEKVSWIAEYSGTYYFRVYYVDYANYYYNINLDIQSPDLIFQDDFESGLKAEWSGLGGDNYWHLSDTSYWSYNHSLYCGNETYGDYYKYDQYWNSISYKDTIMLENLDLRNYQNAQLKFWYEKTTDSSESYMDLFKVLIRPSGTQLYLSQQYTDNDIEARPNLPDTTWQQEFVDLTFFCGYSSVDIIFSFEANDLYNSAPGVFIDDVNITGFVRSSADAYELCASQDDEYWYHIEMIDPTGWYDVFHKMNFNLNADDDRVKLKIFNVIDQGTRWDITARLWEPGDDYENTADSTENTYAVYKNPFNQKGGTMFFIPCDDVQGYLSAITGNYDSFYINTRDETRDNGGEQIHVNIIEYEFDDFYVELGYNDDGILENVIVINKNGWYDVFRMWKNVDWDDKNGEDNYDEGPNMDDIYVTVPGYDIFMVLGAIGIVSFVMVKKMKINRRT